MAHHLNPYFMQIVKGMMAFIIAFTLVADTAAQDDCPYDLNGDGCTCANELLFFMLDYGVAGNTDHDFNENGFRDFEDALMLSRHLGTNCPQAEVQATTGIISGLLIEPVDTLAQGLSDGNDTILRAPSHTGSLPWSATRRSPSPACGATRNSL